MASLGNYFPRSQSRFIKPRTDRNAITKSKMPQLLWLRSDLYFKYATIRRVTPVYRAERPFTLEVKFLYLITPHYLPVCILSSSLVIFFLFPPLFYLLRPFCWVLHHRLPEAVIHIRRHGVGREFLWVIWASPRLPASLRPPAGRRDGGGGDVGVAGRRAVGWAARQWRC